MESIIFEVSREEGLDLLDWLGLDRPEFGAIALSDLRARCRRRLWPEPRHEHARLRPLVSQLAATLDAPASASATFVQFG